MRFLYKLLIGCFFSTSVHAASTLFQVAESDQSVRYLTIIFGHVPGFFAAEDHIMGRLFSLFSAALLVLGLGLVIFNIVISLTKTASEGEPMGHHWSSVWIPARTLLGLILLLPNAAGYTKIQMVLFWAIFNCIGAANSLWNIVIQSYTLGININQPAPPNENVLDFTKGVFSSLVCMEYLNTQLSPLEYPLNWSPVEVYLQGQDIIFGLPTENNYPLCGKIHIRNFERFSKVYHQYIANPALIEYAQAAATIGLQAALSNAVSEAIHMPPSGWSSAKNIFIEAATDFNQAMAAAVDPSGEVGRVAEGAVADGWILAGAYYYKLVSAKVSPNYVNLLPIQQGPDLEHYGRFANGANLQATIMGIAERYMQEVSQANSSGSPMDLTLAPSNLDTNAKQGWDKSFGKLKDVIANFTRYLSTNSPDPIYSMAKVGADIMIAVEIIWVVLFITVMAIDVLAYFGLCLHGTGPIFMGFINLISPVLSAVFLLLWTSGAAFAIYLPLIPYLVYTFAGLTWFFEVIEGIVCAPLVALMLVFPSEDEWGHAGHSFMIYLGILLRPPLMVMGFVAGTKFLVVAIKFLNYGFAASITSQLTGVGLFSSLIILVIYVGLVLSMVNEAFSLIYVLPEKTLRWIGGHGMGGVEGKLLKEAHEASEKGGEVTQMIAKAAYTKANKMAAKRTTGDKNASLKQ
jgi:conjugal transfer/type IV secretion protein DotA/TraY